jgi:hypothetical protein
MPSRKDCRRIHAEKMTFLSWTPPDNQNGPDERERPFEVEHGGPKGSGEKRLPEEGLAAEGEITAMRTRPTSAIAQPKFHFPIKLPDLNALGCMSKFRKVSPSSSKVKAAGSAWPPLLVAELSPRDYFKLVPRMRSAGRSGRPLP